MTLESPFSSISDAKKPLNAAEWLDRPAKSCCTADSLRWPCVASTSARNEGVNQPKRVKLLSDRLGLQPTSISRNGERAISVCCEDITARQMVRLC